jgi:radical SAM protein with 4Fe4S-binding SPASM domain
VDCGSQLQLGTSEYLRRVFDKASRDRVPVSGAFDLTYRCNFRCVHCYVGHLTAQPRSSAAELGTRQVIDLLSQAADAGCLLLVLSGGEPLLRDDFIDIYLAAKRLGMIVTVFTNASLITEEHLDVFAEYPPHEVEVSVYGATEATYARVTGLRGSFGRVRLGIESLLNRGVTVGLKTMILRDNAEEIADIESLARDLGVRFRLDPLVTPRLDGELSPLEQRVEPRQAVEIEMRVDGYRESLARFYREQRAVVEEETVPADRLYLCGAGLASFHIDAQGYVHPCLMSLGIAYNALSMGFASAWKAVTSAIDRSTWEGTGGCAECSHILLCGYCPGLFALEQASPSRPPSYICRLGENRCRVVGREESEVVGVRAD